MIKNWLFKIMHHSFAAFQKLIMCIDTVLPMCNLIEYSKNYSETTGSLWN